MTTEHFWLSVGFLGQAFFSSRFLVQWIASERKGESVVPVAFWYFSIGGGLITLVYSFHLGKVGLPFLIAQLGGLVVYARNLWLIHREKQHIAAAS